MLHGVKWAFLGVTSCNTNMKKGVPRGAFMKKKIEKYGMVYNFFKDYYVFIQEYAVPEDNDLFWESVMHEADKLTKKYKEIEEYCKDLVWAHVRVLERQHKEIGHQQRLKI